MGSYRPKQYEFNSENKECKIIFELENKTFSILSADEEDILASFTQADIPDLIKLLEEINENI